MPSPIAFCTIERLKPAYVIILLIGVHIVIWTAAPIVAHSSPPMDIVEGYVFARQWIVSSHKHPALPSWLLELSHIVTGSVGWPAYLLSSLCISATYWLVFLIGCELLGEWRSAAGTLPLSGILYFHWVSPEFNHNVVSMPIWCGLIWAVIRARTTRDWRFWALAGGVGALGLYAKLAMAFILVPVAIFILVDSRCRDQLTTRGPWIGALIFLIGITVLARSMVANEFALLDYARERAGGNRAGNVLDFALKQFASSAGFYLIAAAAYGTWLWHKLSPLQMVQRVRSAREPLWIIGYFHFVPLLITTAVAAAMGTGLKGAWGTPMLSLSGLLLAAYLPSPTRSMFCRLALSAMAFVSISGTAYAISIIKWSEISSSPPRAAWPHAEISRRFDAIWHEKVGKPLHIVAGDLWTGGLISLGSCDKPLLLINGSLKRSPWIRSDQIQSNGILVIWRGAMKPEYSDILRSTPQYVENFVVGGARPYIISLSYAIVAPQTETE